MKFHRNRHFWIILGIFVFLSLFHYMEQLGIGEGPSLHFGLTRHALDRTLFIVPIIYASYVFGMRAGLVVSAATLLVMLPRAIFISPAPQDALIEMFAVLAVGVVACLLLRRRLWEKEDVRKTLEQLEDAHRTLQQFVRSARHEERRLSMINAISKALAESLELESTLRRAVHIVSEMMEVEVALIFSLDQEKQELAIVAQEGVSEEFVKAVDRIKVGEGFNGEVARTGQPLTVEDASHDPRLTRPEVKKMKIKSQLIVPLTVRDRVSGTICVAMRRPRQFLPDEIELLGAVATLIGTAMENARLYEQERSTAQRLAVSESNYRQLFENANDAIWVHDLTGNITAANRAAEVLTGYSREELIGMNVRTFLSEAGLSQARQVRRMLMEGEPVAQPYELHLLRRDSSRAILMVTTSLIKTDGTLSGFHHIARDVTEEKRLQEDLRYYLSQIVKAQEDERRRIARELHDDTTQFLFAVARKADNFLRVNTRLTPETVAFVNELRRLFNEALESIRRFSLALRPPMLDDLGLIPTLRWLAGDMEKLIGTRVDLQISGKERRLPADAELMLFRAVQEALRNVWMHAQASKVQVIIEFREGSIRASVYDNGKGYILPDRFESLPRTGKFGLAGIDERMRLLGGSMSVHSEPGRGTMLTVEAPV